jgi:hypothetical protein
MILALVVCLILVGCERPERWDDDFNKGSAEDLVRDWKEILDGDAELP